MAAEAAVGAETPVDFGTAGFEAIGATEGVLGAPVVVVAVALAPAAATGLVATDDLGVDLATGTFDAAVE